MDITITIPFTAEGLADAAFELRNKADCLAGIADADGVAFDQPYEVAADELRTKADLLDGHKAHDPTADYPIPYSVADLLDGHDQSAPFSTVGRYDDHSPDGAVPVADVEQHIADATAPVAMLTVIRPDGVKTDYDVTAVTDGAWGASGFDRDDDAKWHGKTSPFSQVRLSAEALDREAADATVPPPPVGAEQLAATMAAPPPPPVSINAGPTVRANDRDAACAASDAAALAPKVPLDSAGTPWNKEIHTKNQGTKMDGTWKNKPGRGAAKAPSAPVNEGATPEELRTAFTALVAAGVATEVMDEPVSQSVAGDMAVTTGGMALALAADADGTARTKALNCLKAVAIQNGVTL